jgi:hypothetical protein
MEEFKKMDLSKMGMPMPVIAAVFMVILIIFIVVLTKKSEGLKPWDTFDARFQQERDDAIGATHDGDSEREKQLRWQQAKAEALVGGYTEPEYEYRGEELPPKQVSDIERTETSLEHSLHSN